MILGLALALGSAVSTNFGFLLKQRGAVLAPPVRVRHPLRSGVELFRSKWFAIGWLVSLAAWGLHVGALAAALVRISTRHDVEHRPEALLLATAAGVLFGVSDVAIKYLTHSTDPALGLISPWMLTALISFVVSFYASARSLQVGQAVEVIVIMSVAANVSAILGGILVFGETIGTGVLGVTARLLAFCLVIAGAALVPAPRRARTSATSPANPIS